MTLLRRCYPGVALLAGLCGAAVADVGVSLPSNRVVTLTLTAPDNIGDDTSPERFTLTANGRSSPTVVALGMDRQVTGFDASEQPIIGTRLHLLLSAALRPHARYRLLDHRQLDHRLFDRGGPLPADGLALTYSPDAVSASIQVDQVGYLGDSVKLAYVGNWLGTLGPMPVPDDAFRIETEPEGKVVYEGRLQRTAEADPWSGNDVWRADFSTLRAPGRYRVRVPALGRSFPFRIGDDVYAPVFHKLARLPYHSRNGMPITAAYAEPGYERPAGGIPARLDGVFDASVGESPLGNGEPAGDYKAVHGGWFDAGDYGQYLSNAAPVWYAIAAGLDVGPGALASDQIGIPESGNGIPDLIDELDWGFTWALSMQDERDGGVYCRLASRHWDASLPHEVSEPRLIFAKTTHATASFAALAAIHARLMRPYDAARADTALNAAEQAWEFLESHPQWPAEGDVYTNPPGIAAGTYPDRSATDNRLWAAGELLRTTGEHRYAHAFERLVDRVHFDPTTPVSFKDQGMAALWAYLNAPEQQQNPELAQRARREIVNGANWLIRMAEDNPFHAPTHHRRESLGWGGFAQSTRAVLPLFQALQLTGEARYRAWAERMPHPQLGANPLSRSFITGIGARPPRHPLSKLSRYDTNPDPLPGIPVPGPHFSLGRAWPALAAVGDAYLPKDYPALRRYIDAYPLPPMSEATIAEVAQAIVGYGLLTADH